MFERGNPYKYTDESGHAIDDYKSYMDNKFLELLHDVGQSFEDASQQIADLASDAVRTITESKAFEVYGDLMYATSEISGAHAALKPEAKLFGIYYTKENGEYIKESGYSSFSEFGREYAESYYSKTDLFVGAIVNNYGWMSNLYSFITYCEKGEAESLSKFLVRGKSGLVSYSRAKLTQMALEAPDTATAGDIIRKWRQEESI